jgi:hypothetical protein
MMKREQCTMGTRIALINEYHPEQINFGYIAGEISEKEGYGIYHAETVVIVQFEERYTSQAYNGTDGEDVIVRTHVEQVPIHNLLPEVEGQAALLLIEERQSSLEARFNAVKDQVVSKIEQAALLIEEANNLIPDASASGKMLCKMREECKPLLKAMSVGGWYVSANYR